MPHSENQYPTQHEQNNASPNDEVQKHAIKRKRAPGGGRKPKEEGTLYVPVSMRLHPKALAWAKAEAKKRGIGYQSLINEILLEKS